MESDYFVWRLYSNGRELVAVRGRPKDVASMVRSTKVLVNVELGIPPPEFTTFEVKEPAIMTTPHKHSK